MAGIVACESAPPRPEPPHSAPAPAIEGPPPQQQAEPAADRWNNPSWKQWGGRLSASSAALALGDPQSATIELNNIEPDLLPAPLAVEFQLQVAEIDLLSGAPTAALTRLSTVKPAQERGRLELLRASAQDQLNRPLDATLTRINADPYLDDGARTVNHHDIWNTLLDTAPWQLQREMPRAGSDARPWLELALLTQDATRPAASRQRALSSWATQWPDHPARQFLPPPVPGRSVASVAAVLPLSGRLAPAGRAVRDGLLAGWMESLSQLTVGLPPRLTLYDSNQRSMREIVDQLTADGNQMIIGPLQRDRVAELLAEAPPQMPVIALNRSDRVTSAPGINRAPVLQLALRAEDESAAMVERLLEDGHRNILLLTTAAPWAERIAGDFERRWQGRGGTVVDRVRLTKVNEVNNLMTAALAIDSSTTRSDRLRTLLSEKPEFIPSHRLDTDAIVLIASAVHARVASTTLAYHYADDIPVYATSHANTPGRHPDLDGLRFCDIPWNVIDTPISAELRQHKAAQGRQSGLFALGVDAWFLHERLLTLPDAAKLHAHTGRLTRNAHGALGRELIWARFENGQPVPDTGEAQR